MGALDWLLGSARSTKTALTWVGMAVALRAVQVQLGDSPAGAATRRALDRVRSRFGGKRWDVMFELLGDNAGIALGALHAGDPGDVEVDTSHAGSLACARVIASRVAPAPGPAGRP